MYESGVPVEIKRDARLSRPKGQKPTPKTKVTRIRLDEEAAVKPAMG